LQGSFGREWQVIFGIVPEKTAGFGKPALQQREKFGGCGPRFVPAYDQAPMEERRAVAMEWEKRWTSESCSASTMTRASCSVPE